MQGFREVILGERSITGGCGNGGRGGGNEGMGGGNGGRGGDNGGEVVMEGRWGDEGEVVMGGGGDRGRW